MAGGVTYSGREEKATRHWPESSSSVALPPDGSTADASRAATSRSSFARSAAPIVASVIGGANRRLGIMLHILELFEPKLGSSKLEQLAVNSARTKTIIMASAFFISRRWFGRPLKGPVPSGVAMMIHQASPQTGRWYVISDLSFFVLFFIF